MLYFFEIILNISDMMHNDAPIMLKSPFLGFLITINMNIGLHPMLMLSPFQGF
ncbi:hypothetical protein [Chryseobacterium kimseyorum]|uniref:hypothetical protein n=1 Tax=Chryseobacterium kimseyorum TaxID=2984028 RepID=UPI00222826D9|nr:hypothetical protein [Chryseobacterium kimseyorum]